MKRRAERVDASRDRSGEYVAFCPRCDDATIVRRNGPASFRVLVQCPHASGVTLPEMGEAGGVTVVY